MANPIQSDLDAPQYLSQAGQYMAELQPQHSTMHSTRRPQRSSIDQSQVGVGHAGLEYSSMASVDKARRDKGKQQVQPEPSMTGPIQPEVHAPQPGRKAKQRLAELQPQNSKRRSSSQAQRLSDDQSQVALGQAGPVGQSQGDAEGAYHQPSPKKAKGESGAIQKPELAVADMNLEQLQVSLFSHKKPLPLQHEHSYCLSCITASFAGLHPRPVHPVRKPRQWCNLTHC